MTAPPPPRYRVVEDGRRLIVTDDWAAAGRPDAPERRDPAAAPSLFGRARQTRFDGGAELTTHPLYDAAGPRTIRLDAGSAALAKAARWGAGIALAGFLVAALLSPWLIVPALIAGFNLRKRLRAAITGWLDRVAREAG